MPYIYIYRYARHTLCAGICEEHIEHKVCQEYLKHTTIVCQEYLKQMGMPGIPYVLKYCRNIFSTRYARNTFSLICTQNIKHNIMPENLGLWVCQAYLMCWNMCWNILYKRYARNTLCKMLVSIFFIYINCCVS